MLGNPLLRQLENLYKFNTFYVFQTAHSNFYVNFIWDEYVRK